MQSALCSVRMRRVTCLAGKFLCVFEAEVSSSEKYISLNRPQ